MRKNPSTHLVTMTPSQKDKPPVKPLAASNKKITTPIGNFQSKSKNLSYYWRKILKKWSFLSFLSYLLYWNQPKPKIFFLYSCFIIFILSSHSTILSSGSFFFLFLVFYYEVKCLRIYVILLFWIFLRSAYLSSYWL